MVVSLHGHDGYAFEDFYVWHHFLKEREAMVCWLSNGGLERRGDKRLLSPNEIYRVIDEIFRTLHVKPGTALLHGFSRGSANIYAVAAIDRSTKNDYFALFIANAGKQAWIIRQRTRLSRGILGIKPFTGSHWITFAGGKDPNPDRGGVLGMRETADWIRSCGGAWILLLKIPMPDTAVFIKTPKYQPCAR